MGDIGWVEMKGSRKETTKRVGQEIRTRLLLLGNRAPQLRGEVSAGVACLCPQLQIRVDHV